MGKKNQKAMKKETEVNTRTKIIKKKKKTQIHQTNVLPGAACEQPAQSSQILGVKIRRGVDRFPRDRIHGLGFQFCRNCTWSEHIAGGGRGGVSVCELRRPRLDVLNELFWRRGEFNYVRANRKFARFISESHTSC